MGVSGSLLRAPASLKCPLAVHLFLGSNDRGDSDPHPDPTVRNKPARAAPDRLVPDGEAQQPKAAGFVPYRFRTHTSCAARLPRSTMLVTCSSAQSCRFRCLPVSHANLRAVPVSRLHFPCSTFASLNDAVDLLISSSCRFRCLPVSHANLRAVRSPRWVKTREVNDAVQLLDERLHAIRTKVRPSNPLEPK